MYVKFEGWFGGANLLGRNNCAAPGGDITKRLTQTITTTSAGSKTVLHLKYEKLLSLF